MTRIAVTSRARTARRSGVRRGHTVLHVAALLLALSAVGGGCGLVTTEQGSGGSQTDPRGTANVDEPQTIHVSTSGADNATGAATQPLRTIQAALAAATAGDTVQVRSGAYRESVSVTDRPGVAIVAAPGERVWLDGAVQVSSWRREGTIWSAPGWATRFARDAGTASVDPTFPMATYPDQVWIDGARQQQVGSTSAVRPGAFYVDYTSSKIYLGTDPRGRTVTASTLAQAMRIHSPGVLVRGISVRNFAPSVAQMGAVTIEAPDVTFQDAAIVANATTGMHIAAGGATVRNVTLADNGMLGLATTRADGLHLEGSVIRRNNLERFSRTSTAGGARITRTRDVVVRDTRIEENLGHGLWFDDSVYGIQLSKSRVVGNDGHGAILEISGKAAVVGNVMARNRGNGLQITDAEEVEVWNNTFVDNVRSINIVQDTRDQARDSSPDPTSPLRGRTEGVAIRNNILTKSSATLASMTPARDCLLCVEDFSGRFTAAEMDVTALGNVYQRSSPELPRWIVVWARREKDPHVFRTLDQFRRTVSQEEPGRLFEGTPVLTNDLKPRPVLTQLASSIAQPIPDRLAEIAAVPPDTKHLGAWLG